ncbi:MAG: hypothetical protein IJN07_06295 [Clostridia bacterium]|nr:hypothetical protein [Clostridia bacterium]
MLGFSMTVSAGDIHDSLITSDSAQVFFGQVVTYTPSTVTVIPLKAVKGDVLLGESCTYDKPAPIPSDEFRVRKNRIYLFARTDKNQSMYILQATTSDTRTLQLTGAETFWAKAVQEDLNNGEYEKAEAARRERLGLGDPEPPLIEDQRLFDAKQEFIDMIIVGFVSLAVIGGAAGIVLYRKKHIRSE